MKKILIFLVAFFPLLAGATTSGFQFDHSSSDLNAVEVNSIDLGDEKANTWEFTFNGNVSSLRIVTTGNGIYQIKKYGDMDYCKKVCLAFLGQMREQLGCWKWYEKDEITEIDGYKDYPIKSECIYDDVYYTFMNVSTNDIQKVIESTSGFVRWIN